MAEHWRGMNRVVGVVVPQSVFFLIERLRGDRPSLSHR